MDFHAFISYLEHQRRLSPHTVDAYRRDLGQFASFCASRLQVLQAGEVDRKHIKSWLADLSGARAMAASSVRRKLSAVKAFYAWRRRRGLQAADPALKVPVPKLGKRLPTTVAEKDLRRLFAGFPDPIADEDFSSLRDHALLALLYQTGMRRAELISLRDADVDLTRRQLTVTGKGDKQRLLPVGDRLAELLACYGDLRAVSYPDAPPNLLLTDKGRAMYPKFVYNKVVGYLGGVSTEEKRSPHVLRHTFASQLLAEGADLNAVKELLGHASLAATQFYTHGDAARLQKIYRQAHPEGGKKADFSAPKK